MKKILLILRREYLSKVRKKSFVVMTILGPILMVSLIFFPILLENSDNIKKQIWICDESLLFESEFENSDILSFVFVNEKIDVLKKIFSESDVSALVHIPVSKDTNFESMEAEITVYVHKALSISNRNLISKNIERGIEALRLKELGLTVEILDKINSTVDLSTVIISSGKEKNSSSEITMGLSIFGGILIYFFIFLYGSIVMRGVMEEKSNRIVEIIISSVKPIQLMIGKIIGIALVGFTQFALWIILTFLISSLLSTFIVTPNDFNSIEFVNGSQNLFQEINSPENNGIYSFLEELRNINICFLLMMFLFYFIGGYLMYGALFAAIGSAVDSESDTQQFMLPITLPLIFSIIILQTIIESPDSSLVFWCSMIPLTSPIVMMGRLPYDPPMWEIVLSMFLLFIGFILTSWIAARIFRIGILMYGQKVNYKTLFKWMRQS